MPPGTTVTGDVIKTAANMTEGGKVFSNIFFHKCLFEASQTDDTVVDAMAEFCEDFFSLMPPLQSTNLLYRDIAVYNVTQDRPMGTVDWPGLTAGEVTSTQVVPNGIAGLITADTGYSKSRPKKYLPGFTESNLEGNSIGSGLITALGTALGFWLADISLSSGNSLYSGTWSKTFATFRPLLSGIVRSYVAYQRRRKP